MMSVGADFYYIDFTNAHLQGSYLSEKYSYITLQFEPCTNFGNQEDCASLIEVNDYFSEDVNVKFYTVENFFDFTDLDNPVQIVSSIATLGIISTYEYNQFKL